MPKLFSHTAHANCVTSTAADFIITACRTTVAVSLQMCPDMLATQMLARSAPPAGHCEGRLAVQRLALPRADGHIVL